MDSAEKSREQDAPPSFPGSLRQLPNTASSIHRYQLALTVVAIAVFFSFFACLPQSSQKPPDPSREKTAHSGKEKQPKLDLSALEKRIHDLINKERQKHGLSTIRWDDALKRIAQKHSADMAKRNYFSHTSPEGHDFSYRYIKSGYACSITIENRVYKGAENLFQNNLYTSATMVNGVIRYYDWNTLEDIAVSTVDGWMNSPGHRKNILTPVWLREGIGVSIAPDDKVYITENFC
jgi:uncharacterized protein YkwD